MSENDFFFQIKKYCSFFQIINIRDSKLGGLAHLFTGFFTLMVDPGSIPFENDIWKLIMKL